MKKIIKKIFPLAICIFLLQWMGGIPKAYSSGNDLTSHEEEVLLIDLNNLCYDIWCEGDFTFDFHVFHCSFEEGECSIDYSYSHQYDGGYFESTCIVSAYSLDDLWNEAEFRVSDDTYYELDDCITEIEIAYKAEAEAETEAEYEEEYEAETKTEYEAETEAEYEEEYEAETEAEAEYEEEYEAEAKTEYEAEAKTEKECDEYEILGKISTKQLGSIFFHPILKWCPR